MNYIQIPDYLYERMLKSLEHGVEVCYNVDYSSEETEKRPEYATGYSLATMRSVISDLKYCKEQQN
jgi:hypothetical protein